MAGTTYTFKIRPGIRYSTGRAVRAEDFRRAIERRLPGSALPGAVYYSGIVGAARCTKAPKACDLSKGIVVGRCEPARSPSTSSRPTRTFCTSWRFPWPMPSLPGFPNRDVGTRPVPAPVRTRSPGTSPNSELVFVRNPFFKSWSRRPGRTAIRTGSSGGWTCGARGHARGRERPGGRRLRLRAARAAHRGEDPVREPAARGPNPGTFFLSTSTQTPPFDDVRVRRALNYAVDRDAVARLAGGRLSQPTCQVLPPNFPGYRPYCPYTANPSPTGRVGRASTSSAPGLSRPPAPKGNALVVWTSDQGRGRYLATGPPSVGYRARTEDDHSLDKYTTAMFQNSSHVPDRGSSDGSPTTRPPRASSTPPIFDCSLLLRQGDRLARSRRARTRHSASRTRPARPPTTLWAQIDRDLTDRAPWLFLYNTKQADLVSSRVGNFQYNLQYGILLDQLWVK